MNNFSHYVLAEGALNGTSGLVLALPYSRGRHYLQLLPRGELFFELDVHLLLELFKVLRLFDVTEDVLHQRVQNVEAVDFVTLRDRKIKAHQRYDIWL